MLIHGDCLIEMKKLESKSIDLVLTDPPYGTTCGMKTIKWNSKINMVQMWKELERVVKKESAIALFAMEPFASSLRLSNLNHFRYDFVWNKGKATNFMTAKRMPLLKTERICVFSNGSCNHTSKIKMKYFPQGLVKIDKKVINGKSVGGKIQRDRGAKFSGEYIQEFTGYPFDLLDFSNDKNEFHPTQKPVALLEYLIKTYTLEGETVLDFTMGSGSTGVACKNLGRKFIGIEKDEKYFEIAKRRIENCQIVRA